MSHKILFVTAALLFYANVLFSQSGFNNAIFVELGGNAYHYSINYERGSSKSLIGRIGIAYFYNTIVIPLTIGKLYGKNHHHFEIAGGVDLAKKHDKSNNVTTSRYFIDITGFIGYRFQKPARRFFLKAGFTPIWEVYESNYHVDLSDRPFYPWAGIGLGSRF